MQPESRPPNAVASSDRPAPQPPTLPVPRLRLAGEGFIFGVAAFTLLSIATPLVLMPLAEPLCVLPEGQHFPSFGCYLVEALAFVLWLGPTALIWHALLPAAASLGGIRITSGIVLGLLAGCLVAAYGRRKGVRIMVLASLLLMTVSTVITVMFVVSG